MTKETFEITKCDTCRKEIRVSEENLEAKTAEEQGFVNISQLEISGERNSVSVSNDTDPDFCCAKCAIKWFEKQVKKCMKIERKRARKKKK